MLTTQHVNIWFTPEYEIELCGHGTLAAAYVIFNYYEKDINEIFNRFYQVSDTLKKHEEGSGIGLCIVEEIVNLHGGKINVYSEVNKGTKFEIILPIYTVEKNFKNLQIKDIQQIVKLEMSDVDTKEN